MSILANYYSVIAGSGGWTPESLLGLHTWLNGSTLTPSALIDSWSNPGSAGAYTSAGTNRPTASAGSPPVAEFDGGDDYSRTTAVPPENDYAFSVVGNFPAAFECVFSTKNTAGGIHCFFRGDLATPRFDIQIFDGTGTLINVGRFNCPLGNHSILVSVDSGGWVAWVDESPAVFTTVPSTVDQTGSAGVNLGSIWAFSSWYSGSILDFVLSDIPASLDDWLTHLTTERAKLP